MLRDVVAAQAGEIASLKAELAERRDQYRAVIQHNPRPTWVYSLETLRFLDVNDVAVATYGWSREEFLAMTIAEIRPREDIEALLANVARMRGRPGGICGPWRHLHKDGSPLHVSISFLSLPFLGRLARLIIAEPMAAPAPRLPRLSPRESEVLRLVARGHTSQEIAARLRLSPKSVETYRARFMAKLGLRNRAEIVEYALVHGAL
ncbi:MAG TPA: LuxR C-terminal-related transcriptional regulator [Kofleriaceae bacterium]|nr:LuxR C-terminal-related transcriptional regulator [Kofleriaceae bacterium]